MKDNDSKLLLSIEDEISLKRVVDLLHDATFSLETADYNEKEGVFQLNLWREVTSLSRKIKILPFIYRMETPKIFCVLEIRCVNRVLIEVTDNIGLDQYYLNEIIYRHECQCLDFKVVGPLKIKLFISKLSGKLEDIGQPEFGDPTNKKI